MHESYFFNSAILARHIQRARGTSLVEYAAKRGLIVPAVRDHNVENLSQAHESLTSGTLYRDYELTIQEMQPFVDRLIAAVDLGLEQKRQKPIYWPSDSTEFSLGLQYLRLIRNIFQRDDPPNTELLSPSRAQLFNRVWESSEPWRWDAIEEAAERTQSSGNSGIQRIELMRTIGWRLGFPRSTLTIDPPDVVSAVTDPELRLVIEVFTKWLAQIHHLCQARMFGTSVNFPVYDLDDDFLLDSIFRSSEDEEIAGPSRDNFLRCEVKLPPLEALIQLDANEVVAIRNDLGDGYRYSLRRWQEEPTPDNREAVATSLRDYCDRISFKYSDDYLNALVATYARRTSSQIWDLAKNSTIVGGAVSGGLTAPLGLFVSVSELVYATYQYVSRRKLNAKLSPKPRPIDVDLQEPELAIHED